MIFCTLYRRGLQLRASEFQLGRLQRKTRALKRNYRSTDVTHDHDAPD